MKSFIPADPLTVANRIPYKFERSLNYRGPYRPPTSVYPSVNHIVSWRDEQFLPTLDRQRPQVFVVNLEGALMSPEALHDLIVPLARRIRDGEFGLATLVVATPSAPLQDAIEDLARRYELAVFIAGSIEAPLTEARPVGLLSPAEIETLEFLAHAGGVSTSAEFAKAGKLELAAAGNRFANVHRKSFVARVERPRNQGHQFIDLRAAVASKGATVTPSPDEVRAALDDPAALKDVIETLAEAQGRPAAEILADLWDAFLTTNYDELSEEFRELGALMARGDNKALRDYAARSTKAKAADAAKRAREN